MTPKQIETRAKIQLFARLFGVDEHWADAIANVESSYGLHQKSPTGALGVFQMTSIAMKDLLWSMEQIDDDIVDIVCGIAFLRLLKKRFGTIEEATSHYCAPMDRPWYVTKVMELIESTQRQ